MDGLIEMDNSRSKFAIRLLPSFTDVAFLTPLALLFGWGQGAHGMLSDCDTGWHIRTGEWILRNHHVPAHDFFSFSKPGETWFAWEWLWDVVFAWLNSRGGLAAVVLVNVVLLALTFALLFRLARRKSNMVVAVVVTSMAVVGSSLHWLARPHLVTLLFLVLFYGALERVRAGQTKLFGRIPYLLILPVATVLWTNLHGGFFVGMVMVGIYGVGELLGVAFSPNPEDRPAGLRQARGYALCALGCLAASLANPYFYHLHVHVAQYLADPYQSTHIMEFLPMDLRNPCWKFVEVMAALGVAAAAWRICQGRFTEAVLVAVWVHAGMMYARNIPLFMIVSAPIVASALSEWLDMVPHLKVAEWARRAASKLTGVTSEFADLDAMQRWHLVSAAGVLVLAALLYAPAPPEKLRAEFDPKAFPSAAVAMLRQDPGARVFTTDQWGDYLIYRLYPDTKVFIDGRSDFYGADFGEKYLEVLTVKYDWEKTLSRYGIDTILLSPKQAFASTLKESRRWRVVFDDGVALVFHSVGKTLGTQSSIAVGGDGKGRDREVTKTEARDPGITETKSKT